MCTMIYQICIACYVGYTNTNTKHVHKQQGCMNHHGQRRAPNLHSFMYRESSSRNLGITTLGTAGLFHRVACFIAILYKHHIKWRDHVSTECLGVRMWIYVFTCQKEAYTKKCNNMITYMLKMRKRYSYVLCNIGFCCTSTNTENIHRIEICFNRTIKDISSIKFHRKYFT